CAVRPRRGPAAALRESRVRGRQQSLRAGVERRMQASEAVSFPPLHLSIAQARKLIASREVSAVELVEAALGRIAAGEKLNVFRTVLRDSALAQAREVDSAATRGDPLGPLAGIPLAL